MSAGMTAFQCPKCKALFEDDPKIQDPPGVLCPECRKKGDPVGVCHRVTLNGPTCPHCGGKL